MVEVKHDLGLFTTQLLSVSHSTLSHVAEDRSVGIVTGTLGNLHDHR